MSEKKSSRVTIWIPESLEIELMRRAHGDDRKLSDFITHLLMNYSFGHFRSAQESDQMANSGEAQR